MMSLVHDEDVWTLPGPTRWIAGIARHLGRQASVLVELPRLGAPASLLSRIEEVLGRAAFATIREIDVTDLRHVDRDLPAMLNLVAERVLGEPNDVSTPAEMLSAVQAGDVLLQWDLRGMDTPCLAPVVKTIDSLSRVLSTANAGRSGRRLSSLVVVDHDPGSTDLESLLPACWRRVLEPLDGRVFAQGRATAVSVTMRQDLLDVLADLGGTDLELIALAIARRWDGGMDQLQEILDERWQRRDLDSGQIAVTADTELWRLGCEVHCATGTRKSLDLPTMHGELIREFWKAQLRSVLPALENDRLGVIELAEQKGKRPFLDRLSERTKWNDVEHYSESEIGQLYHHRFCFSEASEFIEWLWRTRNSLAHRRPVALGDLERGALLRERLFHRT